MGSRPADALVGLVQLAVETGLDAFTGSHWADLANPLPDHFRHVRFCFYSGLATQVALGRSLAVRHQPRRQSGFHADILRPAEHSDCFSGHPDGARHHHLDDDFHLAALPLGQLCSTTVFGVGVDCHDLATVNLGDEPIAVAETRSDLGGH